MTTHRTPSQMLDAIAGLLNCADLETDEEINQALRDFGYDPDELWRKFQPKVQAALKEAKLALDTTPQSVVE